MSIKLLCHNIYLDFPCDPPFLWDEACCNSRRSSLTWTWWSRSVPEQKVPSFFFLCYPTVRPWPLHVPQKKYSKIKLVTISVTLLEEVCPRHVLSCGHGEIIGRVMLVVYGIEILRNHRSNQFSSRNVNMSLPYRKNKDKTRDTETGDPARLPAQVAGRWGLIKSVRREK
jgi:hypothetical protein